MSVSDKPVRTIADIARLAGVSKSTVSRALSDSPLISDRVKSRIQAIAREHNYQVHQGARNLSLRRSNTIAFLLPTGSETGDFIIDPFNLEILGAIAGTLAPYDYDLLLARIDIDDPTWSQRYFDAGRVDALILTTCAGRARYIRPLINQGVPFIVWGAPIPELTYCSVHGDDLMGAQLAVRHLLQMDRQRIAFLGGPKGQLEVERRFQGYELALKEAGYAINPALIAYGDYTSRSGCEAIQQLLHQSPGLDAVFVNSDLMAIAAMSMLKAKGRRVPEDVAVVGYDDISLAAHCDPPLTTIRQNIPAAGKILVETLMQYLQNGVTTKVTMPVELIVRKSSTG